MPVPAILTRWPWPMRSLGTGHPLTSMVDPQILIDGGRNTIFFERDELLRENIVKLFATNHSPQTGAGHAARSALLPARVGVPEGLGYENIFRVIIMQFIDAQSFDVRSVKKSCVHIVHPDDGRLIPFDTYNLFYRDNLDRRCSLACAERPAPCRCNCARSRRPLSMVGGVTA